LDLVCGATLVALTLLVAKFVLRPLNGAALM
jgi:hypothetical protein